MIKSTEQNLIINHQINGEIAWKKWSDHLIDRSIQIDQIFSRSIIHFSESLDHCRILLHSSKRVWLNGNCLQNWEVGSFIKSQNHLNRIIRSNHQIESIIRSIESPLIIIITYPIKYLYKSSNSSNQSNNLSLIKSSDQITIQIKSSSIQINQ